MAPSTNPSNSPPTNSYIMPTDTSEHTRLITQHHAIISLMHNTTIHAPLSHPLTITEIGCGPTAPVSTYLATLHPTAHIHAVDLAPPSPSSEFPENITFTRGAMPALVSTDHATFGPSTQDYVFNRLIVMGMTHWPEYICAVADMLKPGGYVEMQDIDVEWYSEAAAAAAGVVVNGDSSNNNNAAADTATAHFGINGTGADSFPWVHSFRTAAFAQNYDFDIGSNLARYMREAGLEVVVQKMYKWPVGEWIADRDRDRAAQGGGGVHDRQRSISVVRGGEKEVDIEIIHGGEETRLYGREVAPRQVDIYTHMLEGMGVGEILSKEEGGGKGKGKGGWKDDVLRDLSVEAGVRDRRFMPFWVVVGRKKMVG